VSFSTSPDEFSRFCNKGDESMDMKSLSLSAGASTLLRPLLAAVFLLAGPLNASEPEKPKLLVLVVFDQMRGDYLERWQKLFADDGFARLQRDGAWFTNCHYPYATTETGPGHASMLTGCVPAQHGIVMNQWYDRKTAQVISCAESIRYRRVPPAPKMDAGETKDASRPEEDRKIKEKPSGSPDNLLVPTLGDALKEATGGKAKVVGLSFKDASAVLPAGKRADAVYWFDSADGIFVTSSFYRDSVHPWVAEFNKARVADLWFDKEWTPLRPDLDYEKYSGPDEVNGEGSGVRQGVVFPHRMNAGLKKPGKNYYGALFNSPFGNELLLELVKRAVIAEKLGQRDVADLLVVSFSSNDAIGHTWGPDSQEVLDVTLRSDRVMAEFLKFLDSEVGAGQYLMALTADHGVCPLPELTAVNGTFAKRLSARSIVSATEEHLHVKFDKNAADPKAKLRWIESVIPPWVYLNHRAIDDCKLNTADVAKEVAQFLAAQEGIYRTFTRVDLGVDFPDKDPIGQRIKNSFHADRCGDVGFVLNPYCVFDVYQTGSTHGSPHSYDTHVPLLFFGPGVKPGNHDEQVAPQTIAAVLAHGAGIKPPKTASYPPPHGLFSAK
jgi:predicted AlkP superfamily pyrophosphatase or phosphodiesterase